MSRHEHTMGGALSAAVAGIRSSRGTGTALARPTEPRRMLSLAVSEDGELVLPEVPWVPPPSEAVASAILAAAGAGAAPKPIKDEAGHVVWVPAAGRALVAPPLVRAEAEDRARRLGAMLAPGAEPDVIREWLLRWSPPLKRRTEDDLGEWRRSVLLAVGDFPGIAFNDETASLAAQRFEWLPPPATIAKLLTEWLAPLREGLDAARRVATAASPEPPARPAPPGQPLTPEQEVDRQAAIAGTLKRFREKMAKEGALKLGQPLAVARRDPAARLAPAATALPGPIGGVALARCLLQQMQGAPPGVRDGLQMRLDGLERSDPAVAEAMDWHRRMVSETAARPETRTEEIRRLQGMPPA